MAESSETVRILRDTWGVPHIYAQSELGAIYAQGYAMAEDRLPTMMRAYRKAVGRMAEAFGPDWVEHDHQQRVWRHEQVARARYGELSPLYQRAGEAFVAGVRRYVAEHPERVPAWSLEVQPYHLVALARYVIWGWPLGQAQWFLENGPHPDPPPSERERETAPAPPQSPPSRHQNGDGGEAGTPPARAKHKPGDGGEAETSPLAGGLRGGGRGGRTTGAARTSGRWPGGARRAGTRSR